MICLTVAPVAAPVGLPLGVGAHPRAGDGAVLVGAPPVAVGVLLGDAVGVRTGEEELDEVSGTVLGGGPAAGAGLLVEQPLSTAMLSNVAAATGFQTAWIFTASPPLACFSPTAANSLFVFAAAIQVCQPVFGD